MDDTKYIVFKRDEFVACTIDPGLKLDEVPDAIVIRKQDIFAGPALHAYSSSVSTVIETLEAAGVIIGGDLVRRLEAVRDYFFQEALNADDVRTKKVPD